MEGEHTPVNTVGSPRRPVLLICLVAAWAVLVAALMVVDVWDESRGLDLLLHHDAYDLISSNWQQRAAGGTVLFRPLPFLLVTAVVRVIGDPEVAWRVLRGINATLLLATLLILLDLVRRKTGPDARRDAVLSAAFLFSGSVVISAGWFANIFDVCALLSVIASLWLLERGRGVAAGLMLGAGLFCKEIAVLGLLAVVLHAWLGDIGRRPAVRALVAGGAVLGVYLALRWSIVPPGSPGDLRSLGLPGILSGLWRFPETFVWQLVAVPAPGIGAAVLMASVACFRRLRAMTAAAAIVLAASLIYGPLVHYGTTSLIHADNFAGRLYLVPAVLFLLVTALHGRRFALLLVLPFLLWGGTATAVRHHRFQSAYREVYQAVNQPAPGVEAVRIDCPLYGVSFLDRRRSVEFGIFPDARWRFDPDGSLQDRLTEGAFVDSSER